MLTKIISATTLGIDAYLVDVEVDLSYGMLQFHIVGLPDAAIRESKQRILTALKHCGLRLPERKITVNLAPADLKKEGTMFDLPIAIGILHSVGHIELSSSYLQETIFLGELSLDGSIKRVKGILPIAFDAHTLNKKRIIVSAENAQEASLIEGLEVIGVTHLTALVAHLRNEKTITPTITDRSLITHKSSPTPVIDFSDVKGQHQAKRALQIAAAGQHNVLFVGAPGSGKTMLAQRLPTIMPPLTFTQMLEVSKIYSISNKLPANGLITERPLRSPHHTISQPGLVGGGTFPQPGEISLAHHGILFLDELTEFKRTTLEVLRQPLESKSVNITRSQQTLTFPASFLLLAALNPCPCGFYGDSKRACHCSALNINRYLEKLSGPLLDRIDIQVPIQSVSYETIEQHGEQQSSAELYKKISHAVKVQEQRFGNTALRNGQMTPDLIEKYCPLNPKAATLIKQAFEKLNLSMRGYHKLLKVARTIADLEGAEQIEAMHIQEAITYRSLEQILKRT